MCSESKIEHGKDVKRKREREREIRSVNRPFYIVIIPLSASHEDIRLESSITAAVMKRDEEKRQPSLSLSL